MIATQHTNLGPVERQIMQMIWKKDLVTVRDVQKELTLTTDKDLAYTTVMTLMNRLVQKGLLNRIKQGKHFNYSSTKSKQTFVKNLIQHTLHNMIDRFGQEAVVAFLDEADRLSQHRRKELLDKLTTSS